MATPTAHTDAQGQNNIDRNAQQYRDLDLFFSRKSMSNDINKVTDITAIKRSIRNLVLTNHYEKPFHPEIGSGVRDILFEPMTPFISHILSMKVQDVIENFEPRAQIIDISARPHIDRNEYELTIKFLIVNAPAELVELTLMLERLR